MGGAEGAGGAGMFTAPERPQTLKAQHAYHLTITIDTTHIQSYEDEYLYWTELAESAKSKVLRSVMDQLGPRYSKECRMTEPVQKDYETPCRHAGLIFKSLGRHP